MNKRFFSIAILTAFVMLFVGASADVFAQGGVFTLTNTGPIGGIVNLNLDNGTTIPTFCPPFAATPVVIPAPCWVAAINTNLATAWQTPGMGATPWPPFNAFNFVGPWNVTLF